MSLLTTLSLLFSFNEVLPLIDNLLSKPNNGGTGVGVGVGGGNHVVSTNDRLLQLLIKGILYESCVDYCQQKATGTSTSGDSIQVRTRPNVSSKLEKWAEVALWSEMLNKCA